MSHIQITLSCYPRADLKRVEPGACQKRALCTRTAMRRLTFGTHPWRFFKRQIYWVRPNLWCYVYLDVEWRDEKNLLCMLHWRKRYVEGPQTCNAALHKRKLKTGFMACHKQKTTSSSTTKGRWQRFFNPRNFVTIWRSILRAKMHLIKIWR